jgi:adenylosuccinate lyase
MHEYLREHSLTAWAGVQSGKPNYLADLIAHDPEVNRYLSSDEVHQIMDVTHYVGDAPQRARRMAETIRTTLTN